jgi:hypothetical protein
MRPEASPAAESRHRDAHSGHGARAPRPAGLRAALSLVSAASLRFGVGQVAALSSTIVPGGDPYPDLLASFPVAGSGVALGDSEACVSGLVGGEAFVACDPRARAPGVQLPAASRSDILAS